MFPKYFNAMQAGNIHTTILLCFMYLCIYTWETFNLPHVCKKQEEEHVPKVAVYYQVFS